MTREFDEAVHRARGHLRNATLEGLEAARALVDAARVASGARDSSPDSVTGQIARSLDELIGAIRSGRGIGLPIALTRPLSEALEGEIARWEKRARSDPESRTVLRAFLGLRELLWELGLVREEQAAPPGPASRPDAATPEPPEGRDRDAPRVQRFEVEH